MKPIGTITIDFQFVKKSTQSFLTEIMEHADNYASYVDRLSEHVLVERNPDDELVLLALRHSEYLGRSRTWNKIIEKYRGRNTLYPYYLADSVVGKDEWRHIVAEMDRVIEECEVDWIKYWYLILQYWLSHSRSIDEYLAEKAETQIEQLVENNKLLHCYLPQFHYLKSFRTRYEGNIEKAVEIQRETLRVSREFDDKYFESRALKDLGALLGFYTYGPEQIKEVRPFLSEARNICEELGDTRGVLEVLSHVGGMCNSRGEFSEFKTINLEILNLREQIGGSPKNEFHNASVASVILGEGKEALEWARMGLEHGSSRTLLLPYLHLDKAMALILLNRLDEAEVEIDIARELNIKNGLEIALGFEYMVNGLLERANDDFDSAFHSFESAMEINERNYRFNRMIYCLMLLAETEVACFEPTTENREYEMSGQWMERFDQLTREKDLPGYIGIALCLKSELRLKQGRQKEAQQLISETLRMSSNPSIGFLRERALVLQRAYIPRDRS